MSDTVIRVENLSKQYRLGVVGTGTLSHDLNRWWHRVRGKEDPYLRVTQANVREQRSGGAGQSDSPLNAVPPSPDGSSNSRNSRSPSSDYVWALKDINFEVKRGEVLGIIGRNGAGKSTLLKILSRVTAPTEGRIRVKGRIGSLLEVGTGFHRELTGRENIYLNGAILGMTKTEVTAKLEEIVEFSGCARYIDTPVKRYSSGMLVRLGFAVAAHLEPEILVVDEVLAVGDAEFQKKCVGKMKDVAGHGRTILFVSHNMAAVEALCTAGLVINDGRIVMTGDTQSCIHAYLSHTRTLSGTADLSEAQRRRGTEERLVYRLVLRDDDGQIIDSVSTGASFTLEAQCHFAETVTNARVWFLLSNWMDQRILALQSDYQSSRPLAGKGDMTIRCRVPWCSLLPGQYAVTVAVGDGGRFLDIVDHALSIDVAASDVFGTGRLPKGSHALVAVQSEWSVSAQS